MDGQWEIKNLAASFENIGATLRDDHYPVKARAACVSTPSTHCEYSVYPIHYPVKARACLTPAKPRSAKSSSIHKPLPPAAAPPHARDRVGRQPTRARSLARSIASGLLGVALVPSRRGRSSSTSCTRGSLRPSRRSSSARSPRSPAAALPSGTPGKRRAHSRSMRLCRSESGWMKGAPILLSRPRSAAFYRPR